MKEQQRTYAGIEIYEQWRDREGNRLPEEEARSIDQGAIEDLIAADTPAKIREFTALWFPFTGRYNPDSPPDFEEQVRVVSDTREIVMLVLSLKRLADENVDSRKAFEEIGVRFSFFKGDESLEITDLFYLGTSNLLMNIVRSNCSYDRAEMRLLQDMINAGIERQQLVEMGFLDKDGRFYDPFVCSYATGRFIQRDHQHMEGQEERCAALDPDGLYPVYNFSSDKLGIDRSYTKDRANLIIDKIFGDFLQGVRMVTNDGVLRPYADSNLTSLWVRLSESFSDSRITACKTCGLPIIVSGERGTKRLYCNDTCKRKYKRALKFASLVNDDGMELQDAAKASGMAAATAMRILERNGMRVNSAQ